MKQLITRTAPICFLSDGSLLCYRTGEFLLFSDGELKREVPFVVSKKEQLLGWSRLATRLFRFGVRAAIAIGDNQVVLSIGNGIYELDIESGKVSSGWFCGEGIRPLTLTNVKAIDGISDGIYFGGYLRNVDKKPVNIYLRITVDQWNVVYTFPPGAINHIHNIIADPYRQCLWIFTGDFEDAAAIWKVTDNFNKVEQVVCGNQKWRGCVAFALPEGLLYATDTPFSKNHLYLLKEDGSVDDVGDLSGSCIYGCQWKDKYIFSSTVEPDGRDESLKKLIFSKKRGAGIEDDYVRMYMGNLGNGFKEIYREKKDWLPFLLQFGAFKFPAGVNTTNTLYFQPVATNKNDLSLMGLNL